MEETGCIPPCKLETFHLSQPSGVVSRVHGYNAVISITAPRAKTEVKKEFKVRKILERRAMLKKNIPPQVYGYASMIGDISGMAGVLLGISALSIYDFLCEKLCTTKKNNK